jgi:membrane protein DedA with SNARE-associated domain
MGFLHDLVTWVFNLPSIVIYIFVFLWLFAESTGLPLSDEYVLLPAGIWAINNHPSWLTVTLIIVFALTGKVLASCLAYWLGHFIKLERFARPEQRPTSGLGYWIYPIQPKLEAIEDIEERFRERGAWAVFWGRLIPIVRSFISYPAGAARMPFPVFLIATTGGSLIWVGTWTILGFIFSKSAEQLSGPITWGIGSAVLVLLILAYIWNHQRQEKELRQRIQAREQAKINQVQSNMHKKITTPSSQKRNLPKSHQTSKKVKV